MTPLEKFLSEAKEQRERFKNSKEIIPIPILFSHSLQSQAKMEKMLEVAVPVLDLMADDHGDKLGPCKCFVHTALKTLNKIAEEE